METVDKHTPLRESTVSSPCAPWSDGKSSGSDSLDARMVRVAAMHLSAPICHIFNIRLLKGIFPEKWKESSYAAAQI